MRLSSERQVRGGLAGLGGLPGSSGSIQPRKLVGLATASWTTWIGTRA